MKSGFFMGKELPPQQPERIISLVPSQTELLADLGLDQEVIGITKFCVHPDAWFRTKNRVGGTKKLHLEKIRSLNPDLVIANKEENEKEQIAAVAEFAPVWVTDVTTLEEAMTMILDVGQLTGTGQKAKTMAQHIHNGFASLPSLAGTAPRVAYMIWRKPWMAAGSETFIDHLLTVAGLKNVFGDQPRYPETTLTQLQQLQPDWILLSSEPFPFKEQHAVEIREGVPEGKILFVDGEMFSWYGSRLLKAPAYLQQLMQKIGKGTMKE